MSVKAALTDMKDAIYAEMTDIAAMSVIEDGTEGSLALHKLKDTTATHAHIGMRNVSIATETDVSTVEILTIGPLERVA